MAERVFIPLRAILTDDIRLEVSGKFTIVGATSPTFSLRRFPTKRTLRILIIGDLLGPGKESLNFRLRWNEKEAKDHLFEIESFGGDPGILIPLPSTTIELSGPGKFRLEFEQDESWQMIQEWTVEAAPDDGEDEDDTEDEQSSDTEAAVIKAS